MKNKILIILCFFFVLSCSKTTKIEQNLNTYENNTKKDYELFSLGNQLIEKNDLLNAIEEMNKIQILYPNSPYSAKARLVNSYIYFLKGEYEKTRAGAQNFIKYYPGNKDIIYAYYLDAMTNYVLIKKPNYDQKNAIEAQNKFIFINNAFPKNKYEQDIVLKLNIIDNSLANQLILIGNFYEEQKNYSAALNYYLEIFDNYEKTLIIEETLYLIIKSYIKLEEEELAIKYASILGYNYSKSKWYKKSYNLLKNISPETVNNKKWYEKFNPIKLLLKEKIDKENKWFEPKKPKFKLF
ncbi:outer membrane protein assembly factor BamD [Alphaproteobacteria bacterium]|nr:outer membrane protein assembly factor BamD [Alphaproteobacteria bacterium]